MRYYDRIKRIVSSFDPKGLNKYFIFGSSVKSKEYHDIDLGVIGNDKTHLKLLELREKFYDSSIPYKVDVVDFDSVDSDFKDYVFKDKKIVWILSPPSRKKR